MRLDHVAAVHPVCLEKKRKRGKARGKNIVLELVLEPEISGKFYCTGSRDFEADASGGTKRQTM